MNGPLPTTALPTTAFKVLTAPQWAQFQADGLFLGAPVDLADGYIHLSAADQLQGTLDKHFAGQAGLVIAEVDLAALSDTVRWEPSRGGALFPHIYGPLPLSAVRQVEERP
jgi:beta-hydroxylase